MWLIGQNKHCMTLCLANFDILILFFKVFRYYGARQILKLFCEITIQCSQTLNFEFYRPFLYEWIIYLRNCYGCLHFNQSGGHIQESGWKDSKLSLWKIGDIDFAPKFEDLMSTIISSDKISKLWYFQYKLKQKEPQFWKKFDSRNCLLKMNRL